SSFLKSEQVDELLKEIRMRYVQSHIILIGSHINYEEIYKNHYRVFGVIDTTTNQSFKFIRDQIHFYLDELYGPKHL
ncbi:TPA: hypothetical protein ACHU3M_002068, partial [Streptococcus suis]